MPPSASSNFPRRRASAPVKAPFSWPNSSDSISSSGIAAQLTSTNGPARRAEPAWMARATSSLPLPFSPWTSTRPVVGAAVAICSRRPRIAALSPMISVRCPRVSRSAVFSRARRACSSARAAVTSVFSSASGFSMKSQAPRRVALTAVSIVP